MRSLAGPHTLPTDAESQLKSLSWTQYCVKVPRYLCSLMIDVRTYFSRVGKEHHALAILLKTATHNRLISANSTVHGLVRTNLGRQAEAQWAVINVKAGRYKDIGVLAITVMNLPCHEFNHHKNVSMDEEENWLMYHSCLLSSFTRGLSAIVFHNGEVCMCIYV